MGDIAIRVEGLGKQYRIGRRRTGYRTLRETLTDACTASFRRLSQLRNPQSAFWNPQSSDSFWALKDVSFEVKRGEMVGIIGANGAGKSTVLKILSRITEPTEGRAVVHGRLGSLLEVGVGFHPELTGRDNIFLNGAILGLKKVDIQRRFDEIVAFAGVEEFIDTPVKHYSTGMYMRLAFAVAAHMETEILVVDEVLAVGDAGFQKKCLDKMGEVAKGGRTVLFVSHNMAAISRLCPESMLIQNGRVTAMGPSDGIIAKFLESSLGNGLSTPVANRVRGKQERFWLTNVTLSDKAGHPIKVARCGQEVMLLLNYETASSRNLTNATVKLAFSDAHGTPLFACHSHFSRIDPLDLAPKGTLACRIGKLPLMPGSYLLSFIVGFTAREMPDGPAIIEVGKAFDTIMKFEVGEGDYFGTGRLPANPISKHGTFLVDHRWEVRA